MNLTTDDLNDLHKIIQSRDFISLEALAKILRDRIVDELDAFYDHDDDKYVIVK